MKKFSVLFFFCVRNSILFVFLYFPPFSILRKTQIFHLFHVFFSIRLVFSAHRTPHTSFVNQGGCEETPFSQLFNYVVKNASQLLLAILFIVRQNHFDKKLLLYGDWYDITGLDKIQHYIKTFDIHYSLAESKVKVLRNTERYRFSC